MSRNIHYQVMSSSKDEGKFFEKMGKFFASKEVREELGGYPLNCDDTYSWIVALNKKDFSVVGFAAIHAQVSNYRIPYLYVNESQRGKGVGDTLLKKAVHFCRHEDKTKEIKSIIQKPCVRLFRKHKFKKYSERGLWLTYQLPGEAAK